jgi:hypothetical protein
MPALPVPVAPGFLRPEVRIGYPHLGTATPPTEDLSR